MTDSEFDELLRRALLETTRREWRPILEGAGEVVPTPRHMVWEKRFLADPLRFAKKQSRALWQRAMRAAACVLLALSVAFGGLMAASPDARAWVEQVIIQWLDTHARFSFSGKAGQETGAWRTGYLPEGFELVEEEFFEGTADFTYTHSDGTVLYFSYVPGNGSNFGIDNEYHSYDTIFIHGDVAWMMLADKPEGINFVIWTDSASGTAFRLASTLPGEELVRVAEGIALQQ